MVLGASKQCVAVVLRWMGGVAHGASAGSAGVPQSCSSAASRLAAAVLYANRVEPRAFREQIKTSAEVTCSTTNQPCSQSPHDGARRPQENRRRRWLRPPFKDILQPRLER